MYTNEFRSTVALLVIVLAACGPSNNPTDAGSTDALSADQTQPATDASSGDSSPTNDVTSTDATTSDVSSATGHHATIPTGSCFSFATGTYDSSNPCTAGELYTLAGANVDLSSGGSTNTLCELTGPYTRLTDVPRSYASCAWTTYIEGLAGLANEGLIVRDSTGAHHYRVYIVSNTLPNLTIDWDTID